MASVQTKLDDQLKPLLATLHKIYKDLRDLRQKGGYTSEHLIPYQDRLHEIEMNNTKSGIFGGEVGNVPAGQARLSSMLHRCYRLVHSMLTTTDYDPKFVWLAMELEDIDAGLDFLVSSQQRNHEELLVLQKRLDNVDSARKNAAFTDGQGRVLQGQSYLHDLMQHCYSIIEELQAGPDKDVDPSLAWMKRDLESSVTTLHNLRKKGGFSASELQVHRALLADIETKRNHLGAYTMDINSNSVPKGQAYLGQLVHRVYRFLHQLECASEVAPDAVPIANQLDDLKGQLLQWRRNKNFTLAELNQVQESLRKLDLTRNNAAFTVNKQVPAGQAYLHNLMASCYDLVHQLTITKANA